MPIINIHANTPILKISSLSTIVFTLPLLKNLSFSFVGENSSCSLTIEEFKIVWNILKKHKQDKSAEKIVKKQPNIVDVKESEISKRLTECGKFKDYNNIDEYIGDVKFC